MKLVLDTNVLVSALLTPLGVCNRLVRLAIDEAIGVCVDARLMAEYEAVLSRPEFAFPEGEVNELLDTLRLRSEPMTALPLPVTLPDPSDLPFLEVACAAGAVLVTGNQRHYPPAQRSGVVVASPADVLERLCR